MTDNHIPPEAEPESNLPSLDAVLDFLSANFVNEDLLWRGMLIFNMGFAGSAALELMRSPFPDAISDTDIEFYATPNDKCVKGAILALEQSGVEFDAPFEHIEDFFDNKSEHHINAAELQDIGGWWEDYSARIFATGRPTPSPRGWTFLERICRGNTTNRFGKGRIVVHKDNDVRPTTILRGQSRKTGKTIRLIFSMDNFLLDHICQFQSSLVQIMVTPVGAVHMYGEMTTRGEARSWKAAALESFSLLSAPADHKYGIQEKWSARGFRFTARSESDPVGRSIADNGAYIRLYPTESLHADMVRQRQQSLTSFS